MCVPERVYGMIVVESLEVGMPRQSDHYGSAAVVVGEHSDPACSKLITGFDRLFLDDPAGMQA